MKAALFFFVFNQTAPGLVMMLLLVLNLKEQRFRSIGTHTMKVLEILDIVKTHNQESTVDVVSQILHCGHDTFGHHNKHKQTRECILKKILTS